MHMFLIFAVSFLSVQTGMASPDGASKVGVQMQVDEKGELARANYQKADSAAPIKQDQRAMEINEHGGAAAVAVSQQEPHIQKKDSQASLVRSQPPAAHKEGEDEVVLDEIEAKHLASSITEDEWPKMQSAWRRRRTTTTTTKFDCSWSDWADLGDCTKTCGSGRQRQKRKAEDSGGRQCKIEGERREERHSKCNDDECPTTTTTTPMMTMPTAAGAFGLADKASWLLPLWALGFALRAQLEG